MSTRSPIRGRNSAIVVLRRGFAFLPMLALLVPLPSLAAPDPVTTDGERPGTWDMSLDELEAIGLGQHRGDPVPVPAGAPLQHHPEKPQPAKQGVIFVNFDGANLGSGYDNSKTNTTQISQCAGNFAAYGQGSKRDATMQAVRKDWAPFNVIITDARPASGDYTMNMTGPSNPFGGGVLGIAPLDCNDSQTHNNITFAFHSANDQFSASTQATTIGQEVAHSYGLEHVDEPGDIMNPYNAGGDPSFRDVCIQIVSNQGIACGSQHAAQCGSNSMQNSFKELLNLFGPSTPDTTPPTVQITSPTDGQQFPEAPDFDITVQASDADSGIKELHLYVNGTNQAKDVDSPYGWGLSKVPTGTYEFYVLAFDLAGNQAMSNVVTVGIGGASPTTGTSETGSETGDTETGGNTSETGPATTDTGGLPPGFGEEDRDRGCACAMNDKSPFASLAFMGCLVAFGFARRRS